MKDIVLMQSISKFQWLFHRNRKNNPKDKKTDWFYRNEEFDRKLDDRADKNNYRTM